VDWWTSKNTPKRTHERLTSVPGHISFHTSHPDAMARIIIDAVVVTWVNKPDIDTRYYERMKYEMKHYT